MFFKRLIAKVFRRSGARAAASTAPSSPPQSSSPPSQQSSSLPSSCEIAKQQPEVRDQMREWQNAFSAIDTDGDGKISLEELSAVRRALLVGEDEVTLEEFRDADTDGDGFISLEEFLSLQKRHEPNDQELKLTFDMFDVDGDGFISQDELHQVLVRLGDKDATRLQCSKMIQGVDSNGDGRVDFQEFRKMMDTLC